MYYTNCEAKDLEIAGEAWNPPSDFRNQIIQIHDMSIHIYLPTDSLNTNSTWYKSSLITV